MAQNELLAALMGANAGKGTGLVDSLFGPTPYDIGQSRNQQDMSYAEKVARMNGFEQAKFGIGQGAAGLTRAGAGMLGMVDPLQEEAKMREGVMGMGGDLTTSQGLKAKAMQFAQAGDQRTAMKLVIAARQMEAQEQKAALESRDMKRKEFAALPELEKYAIAMARRSGLKEGSPEFDDFVSTWMYEQKEKAEKKDKMPNSFQEWELAGKPGEGKTDQEKYANWLMTGKRASGSKVEVKLPAQENEFEKELGKGQAKELVEGRKLADDAVQMLQTNKIGRQILDKGMVTGFGANAIVSIGQALRQAGINFGGDATANAQAYVAVMAQNVGKLIKQFGAGTGLSDADREYATKMAGGLITVDEAAIRKVLDINDRAARNVIALHNKRAGKVKTNIPLTVEIPEEGGTDLVSAAKAELEKRKGNK